MKLVDLRGNVDTRLAKLQAGEVQGLVLAAAGLLRLGVRPANMTALSAAEMVPAPGQGALALQVHAGNERVRSLVSQLDDAVSRSTFEAERRLMQLVGGGCALPLGAFAEPSGAGVHLLAVVVSPNGEELVAAEATESEPARSAELVAEELLEGGAGAILAAARGTAT
jgi:hydroxymethylbilane synthase